MKKISIFAVCVILVAALLCGCGGKENSDVKELKGQLIQFAVEHAEEYFDTAINPDKFDITIGSSEKEDAAKDTLTPLTSTDTNQTVYLTGRFKGEPDTVECFIVVYDSVQKKITRFGMQKLGDEAIVYTDVQ